MNLSLQKLNTEFLNQLRNLHWRQWAALGVAADIEPEKDSVVDIEALIVSTFAMRKLDLRMFEGMIEWVFTNKEFVFGSRTSRIAREFANRKLGKNVRLIDEDKVEVLKQIIKYRSVYKYIREGIPKNLVAMDDEEWMGKKDTFEFRDIITKPAYSDMSTLHLRLRSYFGTDARADVMMYLLLNNKGNSYSIAKEIYHDQKNVYRILEQWSDTGIVQKIEEPRKNRYSLNGKKGWLKVFGFKNVPNYVPWVRTFLLYDTIAKALVTEPWHSDEYLMGSLLKDLENEMKAVAMVNAGRGIVGKLQEYVRKYLLRETG